MSKTHHSETVISQLLLDNCYDAVRNKPQLSGAYNTHLFPICVVYWQSWVSFSCLPILESRQKDKAHPGHAILMRKGRERAGRDTQWLLMLLFGHRISHICSCAPGQSKLHVPVQHQWIEYSIMRVTFLPRWGELEIRKCRHETNNHIKFYLRAWRAGFDPWVGKIPWRREWQPTPVFLPRESHGKRSLRGNSPWGLKELD